MIVQVAEVRMIDKLLKGCWIGEQTPVHPFTTMGEETWCVCMSVYIHCTGVLYEPIIDVQLNPYTWNCCKFLKRGYCLVLNRN